VYHIKAATSLDNSDNFGNLATMKCFFCSQEMTDPATETCEDDRDESYGEGSRCPDCYVKPGGTHHPGCDQERCSICKTQIIIGCEHSVKVESGPMHDAKNSRWIPPY